MKLCAFFVAYCYTHRPGLVKPYVLHIYREAYRELLREGWQGVLNPIKKTHNSYFFMPHTYIPYILIIPIPFTFTFLLKMDPKNSRSMKMLIQSEHAGPSNQVLIL